MQEDRLGDMTIVIGDLDDSGGVGELVEERLNASSSAATSARVGVLFMFLAAR